MTEAMILAAVKINALDQVEPGYIQDWPPNSPDLNPIESIWSMLNSRVNWKVGSPSGRSREALNLWFERGKVVFLFSSGNYGVVISS